LSLLDLVPDTIYYYIATSADEAGKAIKAITEGYTVGTALEAWDKDNPTETILVLIENSVNLAEGSASNEAIAQEVETAIAEIMKEAAG